MNNDLIINTSNGYTRENTRLTETITNDLKSMVTSNNAPSIEDEKKNAIIQKLNSSQLAESKLQNAMSYLLKREKHLDYIVEISNELKELSLKYSNLHLRKQEKLEIETKTTGLLRNIDALMNLGKFDEDNLMDEKIMIIRCSNGNKKIVVSNPIYIILNINETEDSNNTSKNKYFECKISIESLLKDSSIIEDKILKPINKELQNIFKDKAFLYNIFSTEYQIAIDSINELFSTDNIGEGMKDILTKIQNSSLSSIGGIHFKPNNIDNITSL